MSVSTRVEFLESINRGKGGGSRELTTRNDTYSYYYDPFSIFCHPYGKLEDKETNLKKYS